MDIKLKIEKTKRALLGEGPLWDWRENKLYFVDIEGQSIRRYDPETGEEQVIPTPQMVGTLGLCKDGRLLAALEDGIYFYSDGAFTLAHKKCDIEGFRFNDGKVGPDGRFYVGTMSREGKGAFYRLDIDGTLTKLFGGVYTSNGLAWSSDTKTFYYIDTRLRRIDAFDFDARSGSISGGTAVYDFGDEHPDGMSIDENGNLHAAVWGSNKVMTVNPKTGELLGTIKTPAAQTSCTAFGGKDMDTMFITTACTGRLDDPKELLAGMLFSVKMPYKGVRANLFG